MRHSILILTVLVCAWPQRSPHSNTTELLTLPPQEVFKRASLSIFIVEALDSDEHVVAFGSGVLVRLQRQNPSSGVVEPVSVVITNRHVVEDGVTFRVRQGQNHWTAKITYWDDNHDLCGLIAASLQAPKTSVRPSSSVTIGEHAYAIGAPQGLELTLSSGLVSGFRDSEQEGRVIQTSAPISKGSSGGGLFDSQARLIGVTTFYLQGGQNLNFAIPAERILELASHDTDATAGTPPSSALDWWSIGFEAERKKNYEKAIRAWQEVIRLEPKDDKNWSRLGYLYKKLKNYDEALECFRKATSLNKDSSNNLLALFGVYMELHSYNDAIAAAVEMVRLQPAESRSWFTLGAACLIAGQYKSQAVKAFQESVRLEPGNFKYWQLLGRAQRTNGQLDESIESLQHALRLNPDDATTWYELGLVYSKQGNQEKTFDVFAKLLEPSVPTSLRQF